MLTVISGNNRNGYPCALNKVGDIFQHGTLPFETEGLTCFKSGNSQDASQKGAFPLAGLLSKIFFRVKVTASGSAEVTVSMTTSEFTDLKSGNPKLISEHCSNYKRGWNSTFGYSSSPKLASAKSRQRRSSMQGVTVTSCNAINGLAPASLGSLRTDNQLNIKAHFAFVQTVAKTVQIEVHNA